MSLIPSSERHSMAQVAQIVGVSVETVWRWTLRGVRGRRLESFMVGGRRFVATTALEEFLGSNEVVAEKPSAVQQQQRAADAAKTLDAMGVTTRSSRNPVSPRRRAAEGGTAR